MIKYPGSLILALIYASQRILVHSFMIFQNAIQTQLQQKVGCMPIQNQRRKNHTFEIYWFISDNNHTCLYDAIYWMKICQDCHRVFKYLAIFTTIIIDLFFLLDYSLKRELKFQTFFNAADLELRMEINVFFSRHFLSVSYTLFHRCLFDSCNF